MENTVTSNFAEAATTQIITQVINAWNAQNKNIANFFNKFEDDVYLNPVAPGRNRAAYILGHLISSNDGLFPLFGFGERIYPQFEELFSLNSDGTFTAIPSVGELKQYWDKVNATLLERFNTVTAQEWLSRHTRVSEEDFAKDPNRNKLNVLMGRTSHTSYHTGQLIFLVQREVKA